MVDHDPQRVEALFQAAADLTANERTPFLEGACDDPHLVARVEQLLARLDDDATLPAPAADLGAAVITERPGSIIGRYKLLQLIGEGGFGVVYMAEQQEPVVRKVALKVIKLGMDTREVVARLEAERQALAMMEHPSIAKVLDGGATESGAPYFVMELVRGVSITQFCDENDLAPVERLELFLQVCSAVQHAHQKGVIHRDIKPSNVLVTLHDARPVPKVIDFGVAKAMHTRLTEKTLFTRYEQFIGTPAYMSPEQAQLSPLDIDTRTDIYALGVLLYELLTGTTPFDSKELLKEGMAEIQRIICEKQPPRPSVRISTRGDADGARHRGADVPSLRRLVRGDLDWIVMKALEKDRSRRYASASELAEDIRRHLRSEPVVAGPPGPAYRIGKFLQRNRAAAFSAAIIALALVGTTIAVGVAKVESDRNAEVARTQASHALAALDFFDSTLALANPKVALDPEVTVHTLLGHTADRVAETFAGQPWAEARVRSTIGRAYASLSELDKAEPQLRRAVEIVDELLAQSGGVFDWPGYDAGDFYATLWTLTNVSFNLEREDAFAIGLRARRVGINHIGAHHPELAGALGIFVETVAENAWSGAPGAMDDVPDLFDQASAQAETTLPPGDPLWPIVADTFLTGGYIVWYTPFEPFAERFWRKTLEIQRAELPPDDPETATTIGLLVGILNNLDRPQEAEVLMRESLAALGRVHRPGDFRIAIAESTLGETLVRQGRFAEAGPILERSHAIILDKVKDESNWLATESFMRLIALYDGWGRPARATPARRILAQTCAYGQHTMTWPVMRLALGDVELAPFVEILDVLDTECGGISYLVESRGVPGAEDLVVHIEAAAEIRRDLLAPDDPRAIAVARVFLGWANQLGRDQHHEARRRLAAEAAGVLEAAGDELGVDHADALAILASTSDNDDDARRHARAAWNAVHDAPRSERWFTAAIQIRVGRTLGEQGLYHEAETLLQRGYQVFVDQHGPRYSATLRVRQYLFDLYTAWGRPVDAERYAPLPPSTVPTEGNNP